MEKLDKKEFAFTLLPNFIILGKLQEIAIQIEQKLMIKELTYFSLKDSRIEISQAQR